MRVRSRVEKLFSDKRREEECRSRFVPDVAHAFCNNEKSAAAVDLLKRSAIERGDRLRKHEYEEASWSTRTWSVFAAQRISCALTRAVAHAIARELALTTARDPREDE